MWSRKALGAGAVVLVASGGMAACGVATGTQATPLRDDDGQCSLTRVAVYGDDFQTACWDDKSAFPAERVAEALSESGAVSDGVVAYADAQAMPDFAIFSRDGRPCLDAVAVPSGYEKFDGRRAQRAADSLAAWDDLPEENRCNGGDAS